MLDHNLIKILASDLGLQFFGVVPLGIEPEYAHFLRWVAEGKHAGMRFFEQAHHHTCRQDNRRLVEGTKNAIVIGLNYYQGDGLKHAGPRVAQYARFRDYHKVIHKLGAALHAKLVASTQQDAVGRVLVDSAPLLERALAARTQAGFIGKNGMYIHPQLGSYFLLGFILTSLDLSTDSCATVDPTQRTAQGGCGTCKRCTVHCPTGALDQAYQVDARKCIAYYTIEHRDTIPIEYWKWLRTYVFGCDICQLVCPYNRAAQVSAQVPVIAATLDLYAVATMDQANYESWFGGTPLTRAKRWGLQRNALIALVVMDDPRADAAVRHLRSEGHPLLLATIAQIKEYRDLLP